MAITRTAMVDDDGSGTTGTIINNAWKTELYNQIDAADAAGGGYTAGLWLPILLTDAGPVTGQTYAERSGYYTRLGNLVLIHGRIRLLAKGTPMSGASTFLGGLPFATAAVSNAQLQAPFFTGFGTPIAGLGGYGSVGNTQMQLIYVPAGGGTATASVPGSAITDATDFMFTGMYELTGLLREPADRMEPGGSADGGLV